MTTGQHNMETELLQKIALQLRPLRRVAVALSGGVDSAVLLAAAARILGTEHVLAITVAAPMVPETDHADAIKAAELANVRHEILHLSDELLADPVFVENPPDRCYHCKQLIFNRIIQSAQSAGFYHVCDGTNVDDLSQYRPGLAALKEMGIVSPLAGAGLTKADVRKLAETLCPGFAGKPAMACLATRIPHGVAITREALKRIDRAEQQLRVHGHVQVRVRDHGGLARLEIAADLLSKGLSGEEIALMKKILKDCGFRYATIDLEGYRTGSMEEPAAATLNTVKEDA